MARHGHCHTRLVGSLIHLLDTRLSSVWRISYGGKASTAIPRPWATHSAPQYLMIGHQRYMLYAPVHSTKQQLALQPCHDTLFVMIFGRTSLTSVRSLSYPVLSRLEPL